MPFEKGGRADKQGNKYEKDCIIYEMIKVLNERNYSVVIEPLGMNEVGTDILVTTSDGKKDAPPVGVAVKLPSAFALFEWFPTILREPLSASDPLSEATAPVKLPVWHCPPA